MAKQNMICWKELITGYSQNRHIDEALILFQKLPQINDVPGQQRLQNLGAVEFFQQILSPLNRSSRGLLLQGITNQFFLAVASLFQARIVLQGRSVDILYWAVQYLLWTLAGQQFDWCTYLSNRIKIDVSHARNANQSDKSKTVFSCCNYILAFYHEAFYEFQQAKIPTAINDKMIGLSLEEQQ
ncbi:hypothetical protein KI387_042568, partial [Taxus chinensis]